MPPTINITVLIGIAHDPSPIYLFEFIIKSHSKEYPVNDLCIQQNWNTSDRAKIKTEGSTEHPTILSAITNSAPTIANPIYNHIRINIITGMYFKHNIAILWSFLKDFIENNNFKSLYQSTNFCKNKKRFE